MKQYILFYILTLFSVCHPLATAAQQVQADTPHRPQDSIRISLLTCAAGQEIYSLFGHTALRLEDPRENMDVVFNYGMFSFNVPNFALRFALGQTDYQLGATDFNRFAAEYAFYGRDVWEQTLNLSAEEAQRLKQALLENYQPQNRVYRYNFFFDNCATRPRDKVEACIHGEIHYAEEDSETTRQITWRTLLHQYTEGHPWSRFGIDLCIGSQGDEPISFRECMFIPFYVQHYFSHATIVSSTGEYRPLVSREAKIIDAEKEDTPSTHLPTPLQASLILFILITGATIYGLKCQRSLWMLDAILFAGAGLAGCILAFLVLFSEHPAVSPNWLLIVFHPFHILCLPFFLIQVKKKQRSGYMALNCLVLTLFIALWAAIPQFIPLAVLPLALCLLIRSASNLLLNGKLRINR